MYMSITTTTTSSSSTCSFMDSISVEIVLFLASNDENNDIDGRLSEFSLHGNLS